MAPDNNGMSESISRKRPQDSQYEPIAIVGMGCRLPGDVSSPSDLWDLLIQGRSAHSKIPESRFNAEGFYHPDLNHPNSINATGGYFINEDIRAFDNTFFGINNLEATYMDPQQRKLLEVVHECCENAGLTLEKLAGANIGCYVANFTSDFQVLQAKDPDSFHRYSATGMGLTILANRLSHVFDLRGPSMVLDTACSSSLYSLHTACMALNFGDCDGAIVAGANLIQSPEVHIATVKTGVLSGTSQCHTFDDSADGYGRAEGVGAIFIKRLSDAIRDGDPIRSVIRGTAANSNGKTNGITLPSADGQEAVIRKAYTRAGLELDETDYVEAHGTGTPVGDPIEIEALSRVFHHRNGRRILVGSIKPSMGHSEAVSGISSVIKVTLALENGSIPPTIGIGFVNPELRLDERNIKVVTDLTPWPRSTVRRASINSFGYGGANAHIILEGADAHAPDLPKESAPQCPILKETLLLQLSAHTQRSLCKMVEDLSSCDIEKHHLKDLAFTLNSRRSNLTVRGFLLVNPDTISSDFCPTKMHMLEVSNEPLQLPFAFAFTGQGAQWPTMGSQLLGRFSTFHHTIQELDNSLAMLSNPPSWTIEGAIQEPAISSMINNVSHSQPVCTAIQIGLINLLREWGIHPQAVVGHSSGEIAAAFAAGHITAAEAIAVAYHRGRILLKSPSNGAMMAVGLDSNSASKIIRDTGLHDELVIACVNSPENVTVSGDEEAVEALAAYCQEQSIFNRKLKTDGRAYHSKHMSTLGEEYENMLSEIDFETRSCQENLAQIPMISSVTSNLVEPSQTRTGSYWRKNLQLPVLFCGALETMFTDREYHIIEIGPHPALKLPIAQTRKTMGIEKSRCPYSSTLFRSTNSVISLLHLAGSLFLQKHEVNMDRINGTDPTSSSGTTRARHALHSLPNRKWDYGPLLWHESRISREFRSRKHPRHELLGTRQPGDNGKTMTWRNMLKVKDVPWLGDHKLGQTVVFPAAGYLAIAIEAFRQALETDRKFGHVITFRQVNFVKALALLDENSGVEVLTELRPLQISSTTTSTVWWQFETSSHSGHTSTVHANGYIGLDKISRAISPALTFSTASMEWQSMRDWYKRMPICNINPGSSFQSLTEIMVDRMRNARQTMTKTIPGPGLLCSGAKNRYIIHPTIIDALLQTAWIASTAGSIEDLKGQVPVSIGSIRMATPAVPLPPGSRIIRGISEPVGFQSAKFSSELYDSEGNVQLQMQEMRAVPYQEGETGNESPGERYPMLRVLWKPDFSLLRSEEAMILEECAQKLPSGLQSRFPDLETRNMAGILDLLAHKNPNLRIMMLGRLSKEITSSFLEVLHANSSLRRFQSFTQASLTTSGQLISEDEDSFNSQFSVGVAADQPRAQFDVIVMPTASYALYLKEHLEQVLSYLADFGSLLFLANPVMVAQVASYGFSMMLAPTRNSENSLVTLTRTQILEEPRESAYSATIVLIGHTSDGAFNDALATRMSSSLDSTIVRVALSDISEVTLPAKSIVISTIELREPIIGAMGAADLNSLIILLEKTSIILWVSGGNLYKAERPDFASVFGLSRSIMLELPSIKFIILDIDTTQEELIAAERNILLLLQQANQGSRMDLEYLQHKGVLLVSRFIPDQSMARRFREKQNEDLVHLPLKDVGICQLSIKQVGQMDTIHFVPNSKQDRPLESDFVEVQAKVLGLNAKDVHVLSGRIDTKNAACSAEIAGIVKKVGSGVTKFAPGDRVVVMAPNHFATVERVPEWACCKLRDDEDLALMATIPGVSSTVLYALDYRACLQNGESILIHSAASGVGIAAIQIAKLRGAKIFATVSSTEKKSFLIETFALNENHIFSSRDSTFVPAVMHATSGHGVDVVLNFLTGDLLHDSWRCCAEFGRFVEIGKRDILDGGRLDMEIFSRGATFTAFDLSNLYHSNSAGNRAIWQYLLHESIRLHRNGEVKVLPRPKVFDISDIVQAFRTVSLSSRIGKIAVSLENPDSVISVIRPRYEARLDPSKSYFLVGCLGGLGRSLAKWMFGQGARSFVFLGRSGSEKREAQGLVEDLRKGGADVRVVRGDVIVFEDVQKAVAQIPGTIGGVVQAAMGLDEALFAAMSSEKWHKSIDPKVQGTWNIHNALKGKEDDIEFFLLTSSISGSVGTATESNYCSANAFLDAFARYRRSLGLPAISIGLGMISEVGYLHEHPEIEALLLRKGLHAITESELLQIVDIALTEDSLNNELYGSEHFMEGHVLTGLEAQGLQDIRKKGFEGGSHVLNDPRTSIMARALSEGSSESTSSAIEQNHGSRHLPDSVAGALTAEQADEGALVGALESFVGEKIRNLLLLPAEQLSVTTHLSKFGLDSMLAAEFRQFIYHVFEIDVSFMMLLAKTTSVGSLAKIIAEGLLDRKIVAGIHQL